MVSTNDVLANMNLSDYNIDHAVFLNFGSRSSNAEASITNRILLKATSVGIATNRNIPSFAIPFSGLVRGESSSLAMDLGIANKTIQISGVITDQIISKKGTGEVKNVAMTAQEVAQLIHSSVDSSFVQPMQNLNELIILYPSRVGDDYNYHAGNDANGVPFGENTKHELLPLIPFTWASRALDTAFTVGASEFPSATLAETEDYRGITGFISNFSCEFVAGQIITFQLGFTEAIVASGQAITDLSNTED